MQRFVFDVGSHFADVLASASGTMSLGSGVRHMGPPFSAVKQNRMSWIRTGAQPYGVSTFTLHGQHCPRHVKIKPCVKQKASIRNKQEPPVGRSHTGGYWRLHVAQCFLGRPVAALSRNSPCKPQSENRPGTQTPVTPDPINLYILLPKPHRKTETPNPKP